MTDLRRLLHYLRPYWLQMIVATAALLVSSLVVLALPWAVSMLIDAVFSTGDQQLLTQISVILLALFVLQSLLYLVEIYLLAFVGQRVVADLRLATQQRLLDLPLRFYDDNRVGELVSRVTNDVAVMQTALTETPTAFLRVTVTLQAARSPWSEMAVMMAVPALRPVTLPSPSTVATLELLLIQTMK